MHFTIKPTSFQCNIKCDYCFYLEKSTIFEYRNGMSRETLTSFVEKYINAAPSDDVYFTWQGGEPTLAGLDFFRDAVKLQEQFKKNKKIHNALQTNGILLNDEWCQFLKEHNFLIGISIDGPEEMHNRYRKNGAQKGTYQQVIKAIELLNKHGVEYNTLTVINDHNVNYPLEVYQFLKSIGSKHMQFIELLETTEPNNKFATNIIYQTLPFSVEPKRYGHFMATIFKQWIHFDFGKIFIRQFESFISCVLGNGHTSCVFQPTCSDNFVLESNGDIYECDHFVYPEFKVGNIAQNIDNIATPILSSQKSNLSAECLACSYKPICNGGCPKHRIIKGTNGNISYFCEGYKTLFATMVPYLNAMTVLAENKIPLANIVNIIDQIELVASAN